MQKLTFFRLTAMHMKLLIQALSPRLCMFKGNSLILSFKQNKSILYEKGTGNFNITRIGIICLYMLRVLYKKAKTK